MHRDCPMRIPDLSIQPREVLESFDARSFGCTDAFQRHSSIKGSRQSIVRHNRVHFAIANIDDAAHHTGLGMDFRQQQLPNKPQSVERNSPIRKNYLRKAHGRADA